MTLDLEIIYMTIILPLSITGTILNLLSIFVIRKIKKTNSQLIYNYLIIYCINNACVTILNIPSFYYFTPRIIGLKLDLFAKIYNSYISNYLAPVFFAFGNLMDILICYDRLTIFNINSSRNTSRKHLYSYLVSILLFVISLVINVLTVLRVRILSDEELEKNLMISINKSTMFFINGRGVFANNFTVIGTFLVLRDILIFVIQTTISILLITKVKKYIRTTIENLRNNSSNMDNNEINERKTKKVTINLTKLTLYLSLISIIIHFVLFATFIGFFFVANKTLVNYLIALSFLALNLKHALNFFVLLHFDMNFKRIFKETVEIINKWF